MFDMGWSEMLIVGALALIVVGPKDLPRMMRSVGQWVGQARRLAQQFQRSMNDAAREVDIGNMDETRNMMSDIRKATDPGQFMKPYERATDKSASGSKAGQDDDGAAAEPLAEKDPNAPAVADTAVTKDAPKG